ncbi:unnamed protein product [Ceutorhynchus assimilis]|uniref:FAM86 N-terminal domain-containing protein n=1 Tax=Ceutorhynchus assimilis TaxID=467358 RepID=A0A9N9QMT2_9CUCU|nr:unnamed protein product [Ceutorhynchus assimilis]
MLVEPLEKLSRQFLCGFPINEIAFCELQALNYNDQESLLNATVNSQLVLKYPIKIDYQKVFLKHLMSKLESDGSDIHEDIFSAYVKLIATKSCETELFYKHYKTSKNVISLMENVNLISEGTTGLRTWQASLALSEWCLENKASLLNKNILELGSGIGLTGLVILQQCQPGKFYFSDCHPAVLKTLKHNIQLNNTNLNNCQVLNLAWQNVNEHLYDLDKIDYILAADVVYDTDLFQTLIEALRIVSEKCGVEDVVFACTERNQETLREFLQQIKKYFKVMEEQCPRQNNFVWSTSTPVRIFRFQLLKKKKMWFDI